MEKIKSHMEEVLVHAKQDSQIACSNINTIFSQLKIKLARKEAEIMSTMQARYAGLSDELSNTISSLKTMSEKSEEIATMTANVITGVDENSISVLDSSSDELQDQLQQLVASQDQKILQTAEQVLESQVRVP